MDWRVPFCCFLFAVINLLMVSTGAARLAGVYTKRIATALTLFNTFILVSRMANLLMVPLIGKLADMARTTNNTPLLETQFRLILGSATVGCLLATLLIPTFVEIFNRGIKAFERTNSLPRMFLGLLNPRRSQFLGTLFVVSMVTVPSAFMWAESKGLLGHHGPVLAAVEGIVFALGVYLVLGLSSWVFHPEIFRRPGWMGVTLKSLSTIPNDFIFLNVFVQAFWTVGWMSAVYAGALNSKVAITSVSLSGIITGVSTILLTVFVDPKAALITDQALHGIKTEEQVKAVVIFLTLGSVFGTMFAQILFTPAAWLIGLVASHI